MSAPDGVATVLVVEDNPGDAKLAEIALRRAGVADVLTADRLAGATDALEQHVVDAVLLDLGLPDVAEPLDGVRRLVDQRPDVPVIVLTGAAAEELGLAAIAAGAQDFLAKADLSAPRLQASLLFARQRHDARRVLRRQAEALHRHAGQLERLNLQVAHDLNNALTSVAGIADLMLRRPPTDEAQRQHLLQRIRDRAHRAAESLGAVMDVGLGVPVTPAPTDLRELAREVVADLADDRIAVEVEHLPTITTSGPIVRGVFENLLRNAAVHGAPDEDRTLNVRITARHTAGAWLISVSDDGRGLAGGDLERVFELGERDSDEAGHGVGLASVRSSVEALGGVVWLEPSRRGGLAVRFTLVDRVGQ